MDPRLRGFPIGDRRFVRDRAVDSAPYEPNFNLLQKKTDLIK